MMQIGNESRAWLSILLTGVVWVSWNQQRAATQPVAPARAPQEAHDIIVAKKFVLVDDNGAVRGSWDLRNSAAVLTLFDEKGKPRLGASADDDGAIVVMLDAKGRYCASLTGMATPGLMLTHKGGARASLGLDDKGAPSLVFKDGKEVPRIIMALPDGSRPAISLLDDKKDGLGVILAVEETAYVSLWNKGVRRGFLGIGDDSPGLYLFDNAKQTRLAATTDHIGVPSLIIYDSAGNQRLKATTGDAGTHLLVHDNTGRTRLLAGTNNAGTPSFSLHNKVGKTRLMASLNDAGAPSLSFLDNAGKLRMTAGTNDAGGPSLELCDVERSRAVLGVTQLEGIKTGETTKTAESSLTLFDRDGKVLWRTPLP